MDTFRVRGIDPSPFQALYGLSEHDLLTKGARRHQAAEDDSLPDRVELRHAHPGERVLLVNYTHQPANTPYRSSHAIYVIEGATQAAEFTGILPEPLLVRLLSLRVFDEDDMIIDALVIDGRAAAGAIRKLFENPGAAYIHAHYAARGCYAALITRA